MSQVRCNEDVILFFLFGAQRSLVNSDLNDLLAPVTDATYSRSGPVAKCHPGTREDVIAQIKQWVEGSDHPICWLNGPAGAGKSAISQTIAEWYAAKNRLAGNFFFLRGAGDRSIIARLIPTLAHQLCISAPATKPLIRKVLKSEPGITRQSLRRQFNQLIIGPILAAKASIFAALTRKKTMVIVIDALDECDDKDLMAEFIEIIIDAFREHHRLPFRIFITSRVEEHVRRKLETSAARSVIHYLALHTFDARIDILTFFQSCFSIIYEENRPLMRNISLPWPSKSDLDTLVKNSNGLFIFAVTLIDFINKGSGLPQEKLRNALMTDPDLDNLYAQVLSAAPRDHNFERVIGTIMLLRSSLSITFLAHLLRLRTEEIVHALLGIQSILMIPGNDNEPIRLFHTSLRDFLVSQPRSRDFFIDPPTRHLYIATDCLMVIMTQPENGIFYGRRQMYACLNWCDHFCRGVTEGREDTLFHSLPGASLMSCLVDFVLQPLDFWVNTVILEGDTQQVLNDLHLVSLRLEVSSVFLSVPGHGNDLITFVLASTKLPTRSITSLKRY
jgi:hypothetical protein